MRLRVLQLGGLLLASASAWANLELRLSSALNESGTAASVTVSLSDTVDLVALEFELVCGDPRCVSGVAIRGTALSDHLVLSRDVSPGVCQVLVRSPQNALIPGGDVAVIPFTFPVGPPAVPFTVTLGSTIIANEDGQAARPPEISGGPGDQDVDELAAFSLSASVQGSDPITYAWYHAGAPIESETTLTLDIAAATAAHAGAYYLTAENRYGVASSPTATVTVNLRPTAASLEIQLPEDTPTAIVLAGSDPEASPLTYTLATVPAHGTLAGTAPDFTYTPDGDFFGADSFSYHVSDGRLVSPTATVAITIDPVDDAPLDVALSAAHVSENAPRGTVVGTFSAVDPDPGGTFTYSLATGLGDADNGAFLLSGDTLLTEGMPNYEAQNAHSVRIRVTDQSGLWLEEVFTIAVDDVSPEVFLVTNTHDSGEGSLRQALLDANACGEAASSIGFTDGLGLLTPIAPLPAITTAVTIDAGTGNSLGGSHAGLTVGSGGVATVNGASTFGSTTSVTGGCLELNGSALANSVVVMEGGGRLTGDGEVASLTVGPGGALAPGTSPGTITCGNAVWAGDGSYEWEISDATGSAGTAPGWDLLDVNGTLEINATTEHPFIVTLITLQPGDNLPGPMVHFNRSQRDSWPIVTTSGGITGFATDTCTLDATGVINELGGGRFSLSVVGNDLILTFNPSPPTAAHLACFTAVSVSDRDRVDLFWQTSVEYDTLGFRLERWTGDGQWTPVTPSLIPAAGTTSGAQTYRVADERPSRGTDRRYRLSELDLRGAAHEIGQALAEPGRACQLMLLDALSGRVRLAVRGRPEAQARLEVATDILGPWKQLQTLELDGCGCATLSVGADAHAPVRFYRLRVEL